MVYKLMARIYNACMHVDNYYHAIYLRTITYITLNSNGLIAIKALLGD